MASYEMEWDLQIFEGRKKTPSILTGGTYFVPEYALTGKPNKLALDLSGCNIGFLVHVEDGEPYVEIDEIVSADDYFYGESQLEMSRAIFKTAKELLEADKRFVDSAIAKAVDAGDIAYSGLGANDPDGKFVKLR